MNTLMPLLRAKFFVPGTNLPLAGGKVWTYAAGGSTPLATYTTAAGSTANANPVILDANGEAAIYLANGATYDINVLTSANAQVPGYPVLNVIGSDNGLRADLAGAGGAALIGYGLNTVAGALANLDGAIADINSAPPIIILSTGQSNMPQAIAYAWDPAPNLFLWNFDGNSQASTVVGTAFAAINPAYVGPSVSAANIIARANRSRPVLVINVYRGGLGMENWGPSPSTYNFRQAIAGNVVAALAAASTTYGITISKIDYFVWGGGESDANAQSQTITTDFETWIMTWLKTQTWFDNYMPTFIMALPPFAQSAPGNSDYLWRRYSSAFKAATWPDPSCRAYINNGDLPISYFDPTGVIPYLHYTGEGYFRVGQKLGRAMLSGLYETGMTSQQGQGVDSAVVISGMVNCSGVSVGYSIWSRTFDEITVKTYGSMTVTAGATATSFIMTVPIKAKTFPNNVAGNIVSVNAGNAGLILPVSSTQTVQAAFVSTGTGAQAFVITYSYRVNSSDVLPNSPPGTT